MALMTWTIEARVDFNDKSKNKLAERAIRSMTKELLTTLRLLADGRQPDVAIATSDMFVGREEISMFEDGELDQ